MTIWYYNVDGGYCGHGDDNQDAGTSYDAGYATDNRGTDDATDDDDDATCDTGCNTDDDDNDDDDYDDVDGDICDGNADDYAAVEYDTMGDYSGSVGYDDAYYWGR